jgi:RimJ/RimL family protein N-acetyltransferase
MARNLMELAWQTDPTLTVVAQTLPAESASTAILRKLGFRLAGTVQHPTDGEVWEWVRARS